MLGTVYLRFKLNDFVIRVYSSTAKVQDFNIRFVEVSVFAVGVGVEFR